MSQRQLARVSGVSASNISRIEDGSIDPSYRTLTAALLAAGSELRVEPVSTLADLEATINDDPAETPWHRLRGVIDACVRDPLLTPAVVSRAPSALHGCAAALLAGVAEKLADDAGMPRPSWTTKVPPVDPPFDPPAPARVRARAHADAPPQLRSRNILIAASDLWRCA